MPYFDHNATMPLAPVAREAWLRVADELWHNPSSPYRAAARAKAKLDACRASLATLLDCEPERIVFTSGASEAAFAVISHLGRNAQAHRRVWFNPTEHPCVLAAIGTVFSGRTMALPLSVDGVVDPEIPGGADWNDPPAAVMVMAANNETGVLQPWREWSRLTTKHAVPLVCDASQWLGKLPASGLGQVDWVFGTAHKFGGPKGVGFLKLPAQAESFAIAPGGTQERGHRPGTEDLAGIAAMVAALVEAEQAKVFLESDRLRLRTHFEHAIEARLSGARLLGRDADRLWNTVALLMPHTENHRWVAALDRRGFQVSTGSACASGKEGPSHVLAALRVAPEDARRVLRVSAGWETTAADWTALAEALLAADTDLRSSAPANVIHPA